MVDLVYFLDDGSPAWYKQWKNLFVACSWVCAFIYFVFMMCWEKKSDEICEEIDAAMTSPSDFSVEVHPEKGSKCCGDFCCQECFYNPMGLMGDGQLLAFIDSFVNTNKIFDSPKN